MTPLTVTVPPPRGAVTVTLPVGAALPVAGPRAPVVVRVPVPPGAQQVRQRWEIQAPGPVVLDQAPLDGTLLVFVNGLLQAPEDAPLDGLSLSAAAFPGDSLDAVYLALS